MKKTDVNDFFNSLNAGVFANQIGTALSDVGSGVVDYKVPTKRGSRSEDTALDTPMYVTPNGLELFQTNPTDQLFNRQQAPVVPQDA